MKRSTGFIIMVLVPWFVLTLVLSLLGADPIMALGWPIGVLTAEVLEGMDK